MFAYQQVNDLLFIAVLDILLVETGDCFEAVLHHASEISLSRAGNAELKDGYFVWVEPVPV